MPLPELIEIAPLQNPVAAEIVVPGSKSITNRALILAALAGTEATLRGALWSEDTQVMAARLQQLGFIIDVKPDEAEPCNRILIARGLAGEIPEAGTAGRPVELFVGNAGTAARFLAAFVCLRRGVYRLQGTARMQERPQGGLFRALRQLGYRVDSPNDRLPADIHGTGPRHAACTVSLEESSQFASALLLCAPVAGWRVQVVGEDAEEAPYVTMTEQLQEAFPARAGDFRVEPDASSASYFCAANWLSPPGSAIKVANFPTSDWQVDAAFPKYLPLPREISRRTQLGDSILTAMIVAPFADEPVTFTDLQRLRAQECERVAAMRTELTKCGVKVIEAGESLTVFPAAGSIHGAEIETYDDHRVAMCFGILGLKVPGIKIKNPACVKKTFPNFFQKLAAGPPHGLGATLRDPRNGRGLAGADLFAD